MGHTVGRRFQANRFHRAVEQLAVLGLVDRLTACANQLDIVLGQHAVPVQIQSAVECRLTAHRRQDCIGPLSGDDLLDDLPGHWFDVGGVRHGGVSHDGRRVGVDQNDAIPLLTQRLTGLRSGVIEFTCLTDDDRAGTEDEDTVYVGSFWHIQTVGSGAAGHVRGCLFSFRDPATGAGHDWV